MKIPKQFRVEFQDRKVLAIMCGTCGSQVGGVCIGDPSEPDVRRYAEASGIKIKEMIQVPGGYSSCKCEATPEMHEFVRLLKRDSSLSFEHDKKDGYGWRGGFPEVPRESA